MKVTLRLILLCFVFSVAGCVLKYPEQRNSRYSVDISQMTKEDALPDTWVYRHPTRHASDFPTFYLRTVEVFADPVKKLSKASRSRYDELALKLKTQIEDILKTDVQLAEAPSDTALEITVAIIDIKPIVHMIRDGNAVVRHDPNAKGTKFDLDAVDPKTGEHIFGISTLFEGEAYAGFEKPSLAPTLDEKLVRWVAFLAEKLKERRAKMGVTP